MAWLLNQYCEKRVQILRWAWNGEDFCNIRQAFCFVVCVYPQNRTYKEKSQRPRILLHKQK